MHLIRGNSVRKNKGKVLNMYCAFVGFVAVLEDGKWLLFLVRRRGRCSNIMSLIPSQRRYAVQIHSGNERYILAL